MTQTITLYKIFVSSPSDVKEERRLLEEIVDEINLSTLYKNNIRVELVKWETHVIPGIGEYPQAVISKSIGNDYDIFLGIFWSKFGTPTKDFNSGTEEELFNAIELHKDNPNDIKVLLYFKQAPIPPNDIDIKSIELIQKLRSELSDKGVLYQDYTSIEEFQKLIRMQLSRQILNLSENTKTSQIQIEKDAEIIEEVKDELGLLDYIELGEENFAVIKDILLRLTDAIEWIGKKFNQRTDDINTQTKLNPNLSTKSRKHLIDQAAKDLELFVKRIEGEIPLFAEAYKNGIDNFSAGLKISRDLKADKLDDILEVIRSIDSMLNAMTSSRNECISFKDMFTNFPSMTFNFNHAKRLSATTLQNLIIEIDIAINLTKALKIEFEDYEKNY
jgi:hypothetical protein